MKKQVQLTVTYLNGRNRLTTQYIGEQQLTNYPYLAMKFDNLRQGVDYATKSEPWRGYRPSETDTYQVVAQG